MSAKYTFGKILNGHAKIQASYGNINKTTESTFSGKIHFEYDIKKDFNIDSYENNVIVQFEVSVIDKLTDNEQKASTEVQVHNDPYFIKLISFPTTFKPGMWFKLHVGIFDFDGNPVINPTAKIQTKSTFFDNNKKIHEIETSSANKINTVVKFRIPRITKAAHTMKLIVSTRLEGPRE